MIGLAPTFLSHLSGDEATLLHSIANSNFLSHLSGDEVLEVLPKGSYDFLSHLSGDEAEYECD